jgi:membrane protease YdiL (CAAX protease family)
MGHMSPVNSRRAVLVYVGFTVAFSSIFYFLIARSGHSGGRFVSYVGCLMWCPGLAALVTCKCLGRDLSTLGWNWGKSRYQVACYLIPLAYGTLSYGFVWLTGFGGFYNKPFVEAVSKDLGLGPMPPWLTILIYSLFTGTISVIMDLATVLGEEIGWRGFLVPELAKRHGFAATAIISGLIWALWHYPLLLLGDYHPDTPVWFYLPLFTLCVPLINFVWTWMRLKSGSLWPCVILHAAHNTFIQRFFEPLTVYNKKTPYMASEFGAVLGVISIFLAVYFWTRRDEVEVANDSAAGAAALTA